MRHQSPQLSKSFAGFFHLCQRHHCVGDALFFSRIHILGFFPTTFASTPQSVRPSNRVQQKLNEDLALLFRVALLILLILNLLHQVIRAIYQQYLEGVGVLLLEQHWPQLLPRPFQQFHQVVILMNVLHQQLLKSIRLQRLFPKPQPFEIYDLPFHRLFHLDRLIGFVIEQLQSP